MNVRPDSSRPARALMVLALLAAFAAMTVGVATAEELPALAGSTAPTAEGVAAPAVPALPATATKPLSDAQLRATDPAGYRAVMSQRAALEKTLLAKVHAQLGTSSAADAFGESLAVAAVSGAVSPYAYLTFTLTPSTGDWSYNGYRGNLYFTWGIYNGTVDAYKWYTVSWPAISGNNRPSSQSVSNVGPIPEYTWDFGFIGTTWQGYGSNYAEEFYPGEWRLSPWTNAPYGRCYFETHGGSGSHYFRPTHGCIRLTPSNISALKTYYDSKMANKHDRSTAHLTVNY